MRQTRRTFLKQLGLHGLAYLSLPSLGKADVVQPGHSFLRGINTYYLLVEAYRHVLKTGKRDSRQPVYEYLVDKLRLPDIQKKCNINAIRYWAFNDYPDMGRAALPGTADGRLWKNSQQIDQLSFEVLASITEILGNLGFTLVPVLANYWPSYGGILQYLAWTGELTEQDYIDALCHNRESELYLDNTLRFFSSPKVEKLYRQHISHVLPLFRNNTSVRIIELMNEPRGKNPFSLANKPLPDGRMSSDIIAGWLNRQATWIQQNEYSGKQCPYISSGEEGWLENQVPSIELRSLSKGGQYYEGIDLLKNIAAQSHGINIASIHMYTHMATKLKKINSCGFEFVDQRGWAHLARQADKMEKTNFVTLAEEWILSRAQTVQGYPWYIGEMAWCWPGQEKKAGTAEVPHAILIERKKLYQQWINLARKNGAQGVFLWMLDGLEHKDRFYGMNQKELAVVTSGREG